MDIVVLAGGLSYERDVSLSSGAQIADALEKKGHRALLLDVYSGTKAEEFSEAYDFQKNSEQRRNYTVGKNSPELVEIIHTMECDLVGKNVIKVLNSANFCFLGLHGGIGENGQIQALLDIYNIPYSGSGYKGSLLAMDKDVSKQLMVMNQILTPKWTIVEDTGIIFTGSCVVKPIDNGSSIGVEIVESKEELAMAIKNAEKFKSKIMVEEKIEGREFSVGILGNETLPAIEIIPKKGFYNYENKYQTGATIEITPAEIPDELTQQMKNLALKAHNILNLSVYSRADFIVTEDLEIFCIEVNSLPGMTPTSLIPQEAAAIGIDFPDLCEAIVELSLEK